MNNPTLLPPFSVYKRPSASHFFILLIACLFLISSLICCSPYGQDRRRIPEAKEAKTADQIIIELKKGLNLSSEQEVNIRPIIEEQVKKRSELIKKYQGQDRQGMDSLRYELKDLRISTATQLQYLLTNEQMVKYGYMQEDDERIGNERTQEEGPPKPKGRGRGPGDSPR